MNQDRLWAPWRMSYIAGDRTVGPQVIEPTGWLEGADETCFLCRAAAEYAERSAAARQNLVVAVGEHSVAVLNKYPYNNGHLLIAPRRHVAQLAELTDAEHLEAMHTLARFTELYAEEIKAEGFNIGLNLNRPAGAGVPGHLHWHLVPRWTGDSNFMPVTANARVISQSLDELWSAIRKEETNH
jgi:ATP adenylyltransferase